MSGVHWFIAWFVEIGHEIFVKVPMMPLVESQTLNYEAVQSEVESLEWLLNIHYFMQVMKKLRS